MATPAINILVQYQIVAIKKHNLSSQYWLSVTSQDKNKNVTLVHVKGRLKNALRITKIHLTKVNAKVNELSKEFWEIKYCNATPKITWKIIRMCRPYNLYSKHCLLCLNEKYEIATYKGDKLLKKRIKIINNCWHRSKYKLTSNSRDKVPLQCFVLNCSVIFCKPI